MKTYHGINALNASLHPVVARSAMSYSYPIETERSTGVSAESGLIRLALYWIQDAPGDSPTNLDPGLT